MPSFTIESGKETGLVQVNVPPKSLVLCQIAAINPATLLVDSGSDMVYLCTTPAAGVNTLAYNGNTYLARLQNNLIDQIQAQSAQGYDIPGSITLEIADGDFNIWTNHANQYGWRGGTLTALFVLWDLASNTFSTNAYTWTFILDKPNIDATGKLTVAGQARQSMTRLTVPNFARQNRCGNQFPATAAQRLDGLKNFTSPFWGCGYSPDQSGGVGNQTTPNLTNPDGSPLTDASGNYVVCDFTRSCGSAKATVTQGCMARLGNYSGSLAADGDITKDSAGRSTARFTGDTWSSAQGWSGKQYTNPGAGTQYGFNTPNPATGSTYYNQGYGTQWVAATVLAPAGDPNSDRAECVVCMAPVNPASILQVVVNGETVTQNNSDVLFTYRILSAGGRSGVVNGDALYNSQGDPHGSQCVIEIVVPAQLASPGSVMNVQVLVQFPPAMRLYPIASAATSGGSTVITLPAGIANGDVASGVTVYVKGNSGIPDGAYPATAASSGPPGTITISGAWAGTGGAVFYMPTTYDSAMYDSATGAYAENPVWALLDLEALWGPFTVADFDQVAAAWYAAAQFCRAQMSYTSISGSTATHARYRCSLVLANNSRQSMAKAVLGIRNCAGIALGRDPVTGQVQPFIEGTLADQQPLPIAGSNYNIPIASYTAGGNATLSSGISSGVTTIPLSYAMQLVNSQIIQIGSEMMQVTAGAGTGSITVTRGYNSTTPASHASGVTVRPCGYLAYLFDGNGSIEQGTFKLGGTTLNDTPNTVAFGFQDSANAWVQDSLTTVDPDGFVRSGNQEISNSLQILGIENFDQGTRRSNIFLGQSMYGNNRFDAGGTELPTFKTSVKAAHLASRPGLLCGINYGQLSV